ncbi:MAG: hypothetical protein RJA22_3285 [Verrucomicrobiota bacterium]
MMPPRPPAATRLALAGLACWLLTPVAVGAAPAAAAPRTAATNRLEELVIVCEGGAVATPTNAVWRKNVRAADAQIYLECQELTALIRTRPETNAVRGAATAAPRADAGDGSTNRARIEAIIADTDVMILTPELQILGDRAVYTATNDVLRVSGVLVLVSDGRGSTLCTNFTFDRTANVVTIEGPQATVLKQSAFSRTNAPARPPGPRP